MTTSIKLWKEMLLNAVDAQLAPCGFKKHGGQSFHKLYNWGKAAIHLSVIKHPDDFDVTVDVAIRFDALEELVQQSNKFLTAKEKRNTFSMGAELGNLVEGKPRRWSVASHADVHNVAEQVQEQITSTAFPYIEQYGDMAKALQVLAGNDRDAWIHSPIAGERAKRAVGLAWLLGDKDKVKRLIESKTDLLRDRNDFGLADFEAFVKSLGEEMPL
jgi:hypothetical protein